MPEAKDVEQTRERMLRWALELFTERGYEGASIQMIASGVGLSKAAVSYHFRTKEDILNAVVEPAFSDLETLFEKVGTGPVKPARRREAISEYVRLLVKHRQLLAFLAKEGDRENPEPVMRQWRSVAENLEQLFGGDREDLSERLYFAAAVRGLATAPVRFAEVSDDELGEHLQRAAERMLARPPRRPA
ncbi:TetR family transcriptional regulator [Streptomyces coeruleorubidus]|uniref:TetR family transcriptional regulator n=1 Tax=Streptomyces coeruleorubidus TaxID=116188 RepID=UPI00369A1ACE